MPWEEVIHKHILTTDNVDIGDVEKVGNGFIVVREGVANVHLYYIPKSYISNYDGSSLYFNSPSGLVSAKFEKDSEPTPEDMITLANFGPRSAEPAETWNRYTSVSHPTEPDIKIPRRSKAKLFPIIDARANFLTIGNEK